MTGQDKGTKKPEFRLIQKFSLNIKNVLTSSPEDRAILDSADEYLQEHFDKNMIMRDETKALVVTMYQAAIDYYRVKREYGMEEERARRLIDQIKKVREE